MCRPGTWTEIIAIVEPRSWPAEWFRFFLNFSFFLIFPVSTDFSVSCFFLFFQSFSRKYREYKSLVKDFCHLKAHAPDCSVCIFYLGFLLLNQQSLVLDARHDIATLQVLHVACLLSQANTVALSNLCIDWNWDIFSSQTNSLILIELHFEHHQPQRSVSWEFVIEDRYCKGSYWWLVNNTVDNDLHNFAEACCSTGKRWSDSNLKAGAKTAVLQTTDGHSICQAQASSNFLASMTRYFSGKQHINTCYKTVQAVIIKWPGGTSKSSNNSSDWRFINNWGSLSYYNEVRRVSK